MAWLIPHYVDSFSSYFQIRIPSRSNTVRLDLHYFSFQFKFSVGIAARAPPLQPGQIFTVLGQFYKYF